MRLPGLIAAAAEVLADIEARHRPASEALRDWGLSHRFAGSGDRASIGNLVYDALRRRASIAWRIGGDTPWHLAVGTAVLSWGNDPRALNESFAEDRHAPESISEATLAHMETVSLDDAPGHVRADLPEWLAPHFEAAFGADWVAEGAALAERPPLDLRVNTLKGDREKAVRQLQRLGVEPTPFSPVGLRIPPAGWPRRHPNIQAEEAFQRGRIEVQDEASQLCALMVGAEPGEQVLDACAGSGGKTLAITARMENRGQVYAHDSGKNRLAPIFERLKRAGARNVQVLASASAALSVLAGRMDRVLVDAPCTGTGVWRRRPDAKWRVTPEQLERRIAEQDAALASAAPCVKRGGVLVYATCSLLRPENEERVAAFLSTHAEFARVPMRQAWDSALPKVPPPGEALAEASMTLTPRRSGTDGFFLAVLRRAS